MELPVIVNFLEFARLNFERTRERINEHEQSEIISREIRNLLCDIGPYKILARKCAFSCYSYKILVAEQLSD